MRALLLTAAAFLLVAGGACGAQDRLQATGSPQEAIEAPRPPGTSKKMSGGLVEQVACPSAKTCAAYGGWMYSERDGRWKAVKTPTPARAGTANLRSLACAAAGRCEAVGIAGEQHALTVSQAGGRWSPAGIALPDDAAPVDPPSGPWPALDSVSCASAGGCVALGYYGAADHSTHALLTTETNGTWGAGTTVALPPDASTAFPPPDSESFAGGFLSSASCPSAGNCTTVGSYTKKDPNGGTGGAYPWEFDETGGSWAPGVGLELPAGAATTVDYRGGGASPFLGFTGLSCPSAGNCTAVGGYVDGHSDSQGAIFEERGGRWSTGIRASMPRYAATISDPMQLLNPMVAVSCAALDSCAAVGWFIVNFHETQHGLLLTERAGNWKASAISLPAGVQAPGGVFLTSISCPSRGNCVAVGYYAGHGKTHGLVVRERRGRWGRAFDVALPSNAATSSSQHTFLNSVTCPSSRFCLAGGSYADRSGATRGLLVDLRLR
jgi:hypothetical protein